MSGEIKTIFGHPPPPPDPKTVEITQDVEISNLTFNDTFVTFTIPPVNPSIYGTGPSEVIIPLNDSGDLATVIWISALKDSFIQKFPCRITIKFSHGRNEKGSTEIPSPKNTSNSWRLISVEYVKR